jgi:ketosteroid isomerase-like protein
MKKALLLPVLLTLAAGSLPAQTAAPLPKGPSGAVDHTLLSSVGAEQLIPTVRAADDERVAATIAADPARLAAIFSDELRYAHSSGKVDTKASYTQSLVSHATVYESFEYRERNFRSAGPGIVLMTGRVLIHSRHDGPSVVMDLNFLAVWREENGHWRFLAWQSCRNPPPPPGK